MKSPFIFEVLDISTAHMTQADATQLQENLESFPAYELGEYGWLCYVGELEENWPMHKVSATLRDIMKQAKELGCDYVRFDRDGREYDDLPKFDW